MGHNHGGIAAERLQSFIDRIERLEEEKRGLGSDIREVYAEAKGAGFDTKVIRQIVRERQMDEADRQEREALLDVYRRALGMLSDTPLGQSALSRAATREVQQAVKNLRDSVPDGTRMSIKTPDGEEVVIADKR